MPTVSIPELRVPARTAPRGIDGHLHEFIARHLGVGPDEILSYRILRRSTDARKKPNVFLLYHLHVMLCDTAKPHSCEMPEPPAQTWCPPSETRLENPLVVGSGPAGLFAALLLASAGCRPVLIERGRDVGRRKLDVEAFLRTRTPDPESNFLYGEGGAGTWSDGKLFTRIRDPRIEYVLRVFAEAGAPEQILYFAHPHIGSDLLPGVIAAIRKKILALGGTVLWGQRAESLLIRDGKCRGVRLAGGDTAEAPATLIASGHSARDLILSLISSGCAFAMKGFQTGVRIEHRQSFIDRARYGGTIPAAGAAEYALSASAPGGSGVVSFCMCPGGEIIPAVSQSGHLRTNGMSNAARSGPFANTALVTTFPPETFATPGEAFDFLAGYENEIFRAGGSDYTFPAQTAEDFLNGRRTVRLPETSCRTGVTAGDLRTLLPRRLTDALRRALPEFERRMPGFIRGGVLTGIETGVSSPVRFLRHPDTLESSIPGLWLAGEGAGCAGGITSAAVDGLRAAEQMMRCLPR